MDLNMNTVFVIILWAFVTLLGVSFSIKPLWMWFFTESWKPGSEDGPTKEYLRFARTFGVILAVVGLGMLAFTIMVLFSGQ